MNFEIEWGVWNFGAGNLKAWIPGLLCPLRVRFGELRPKREDLLLCRPAQPLRLVRAPSNPGHSEKRSPGRSELL